MVFIGIWGTGVLFVSQRRAHTRSVSDVGDVKVEIAFLEPLLYFKGSYSGLMWFLFWEEGLLFAWNLKNSFCLVIWLHAMYLLKSKMWNITVASCGSCDTHSNGILVYTCTDYNRGFFCSSLSFVLRMMTLSDSSCTFPLIGFKQKRPWCQQEWELRSVRKSSNCDPSLWRKWITCPLFKCSPCFYKWCHHKNSAPVK